MNAEASSVCNMRGYLGLMCWRTCLAEQGDGIVIDASGREALGTCNGTHQSYGRFASGFRKIAVRYTSIFENRYAPSNISTVAAIARARRSKRSPKCVLPIS